MADSLRARFVDLAKWDRRKKQRRSSGGYQTAIRTTDPIGKVSGHAEDLTATPTPADAEWEPTPNPPGWVVAKNREREVRDDVTGDYIAWLNSPEGAPFRFTAVANFRLAGGDVAMSDEQVVAAVAAELAEASTRRVYRDWYGLERPVGIPQ